MSAQALENKSRTSLERAYREINKRIFEEFWGDVGNQFASKW